MFSSRDYVGLQEELFRVVKVTHAKDKIPSVLLITHYGFIKELIYLLKKKINREMVQKSNYLGYYA